MSIVLKILLTIWLVFAIIVLQMVNFIITSIEYCVTNHKHQNLQSLFTKNSKYLDELLNSRDGIY